MPGRRRPAVRRRRRRRADHGPGHLLLRPALGHPARRRGHRRAHRHAGVRARGRRRAAGRAGQRLRPGRGHPARRRHDHPVRPRQPDVRGRRGRSWPPASRSPRSATAASRPARTCTSRCTPAACTPNRVNPMPWLTARGISLGGCCRPPGVRRGVQDGRVRTAARRHLVRAAVLVSWSSPPAAARRRRRAAAVATVRSWVDGAGPGTWAAMVLGGGGWSCWRRCPRSAVSVLLGVVAGFQAGVAVALAGGLLGGLAAFGLSRTTRPAGGRSARRPPDGGRGPAGGRPGVLGAAPRAADPGHAVRRRELRRGAHRRPARPLRPLDRARADPQHRGAGRRRGLGRRPRGAGDDVRRRGRRWSPSSCCPVWACSAGGAVARHPEASRPSPCRNSLPSTPPAPPTVRAASCRIGPPGMPGTACTIGASWSSPPTSCTLSLRRATAGHRVDPARRPPRAAGRRRASTAGPSIRPAGTCSTVQPPPEETNVQPAVGGGERDLAVDGHRRGERAGDVGQRGQPGLQDVGRRGSGAAGHQVQPVDGELVGLPQDDAEQRDPADDGHRERGVELLRLLGQVAGGGLAVAPQAREDLLAGGVAVRRDHPGVRRVDVRRGARAARAGGGDQVGHGGVVVPAAEVDADLVRPPAAAAGTAGSGRPSPPAR